MVSMSERLNRGTNEVNDTSDLFDRRIKSAHVEETVCTSISLGDDMWRDFKVATVLLRSVHVMPVILDSFKEYLKSDPSALNEDQTGTIMAKRSITIEPQLRDNYRVEAKRQGVSFSQYFRGAIRHFLAHEEEMRKKIKERGQ